jgi:hypothetical protein
MNMMNYIKCLRLTLPLALPMTLPLALPLTLPRTTKFWDLMKMIFRILLVLNIQQ